MNDNNVLEFLLVCKNCNAEYLAEMPVDEIDMNDELAPMECEDCGSDIDANAALKQAIANSKK
ncbi:hypothetical protein [Kordiimonas sp. SCSIO 12610]|uniref:hypothetical protein n=1 Tax=Kordiimonas sp. SCSIO 12610 TaxID=2829597 RepID=UPI00210BEFD9|nr:hypothetical protein [Kordiimonas sp. SCSIO 12610]UTW54840.1 hypothetical protein KFF44_13660 [Kordiimonas sp. SCSIO 12610]